MIAYDCLLNDDIDNDSIELTMNFVLNLDLI